jgi:integrase
VEGNGARTGRSRGNGEGSIRQVKPGLWQARLYFDGQSHVRYAKTRAAADKLLTELKYDRDKGIPIVTEHQTVRQYLTDWLESVRLQLRESSFRRYSDYVRIHLIPGLGRYKLERLTAQQIQALYTTKRNEGLSATTVNSMHGVLHRALEDAERLGLVQRNASKHVRAPRRDTAEIQTMTEEQANQFLAAAKDDRFYALYVLALMTGMREGELLGLRWSDVNLSAGWLQVRVAVQEADKGFILAEPKTAYSKRRITLPSTAVEALRQHRIKQDEEQLKSGESWNASLDLVFPSMNGGLMIPHNLTKRGFKKLLAQAGLPDLHFHCLRHTAATLLLSRGVHVKVVSEMLGHADVTITLRTYAHVTPNMQQAAADEMEKVFGLR